MILRHLTRMNEHLEGALWKKGFPEGLTRDAVRLTILLALLLIAGGTIFLPVSTRLFWAGFGAVLAAWNFYSLSHFVLHSLPRAAHDGAGEGGRKSFFAGQLLRSNLRLFITGILLYLALVVCEADIFSLLAGRHPGTSLLPGFPSQALKTAPRRCRPQLFRRPSWQQQDCPNRFCFPPCSTWII